MKAETVKIVRYSKGAAPAHRKSVIAENFVRLQGLAASSWLTGNNEYVEMLAALQNDHSEMDTNAPLEVDMSTPRPGWKIYLGFEREPAAKGNHHAYEGGLVVHLLEMWNLWVKLAPLVGTREPHLTNDRILQAILNHDIHKAFKTYELLLEDPWKVQYSNDISEQLMTWDTKSLWLLGQHKIPLDEEQMNALLWAEGGFSRIKPKECSVLAKMAYLLDELSGNVMSRLEDGSLLGRSR